MKAEHWQFQYEKWTIIISTKNADTKSYLLHDINLINQDSVHAW